MNVNSVGQKRDTQGMQYWSGKLMWYRRGTMQLKSWSLDVAVPCGPLQEVMAPALKGWCPGKLCQASFPGHLHLLEDGERMPWELIVYRKNSDKIMKTAICGR